MVCLRVYCFTIILASFASSGLMSDAQADAVRRTADDPVDVGPRALWPLALPAAREPVKPSSSTADFRGADAPRRRPVLPHGIKKTSFFFRRLRHLVAGIRREPSLRIDRGAAEVAGRAQAQFQRIMQLTYPVSHIATAIDTVLGTRPVLQVRMFMEQRYRGVAPAGVLKIQKGGFLGAGTYGAVFAVATLDGSAKYAMKILLARCTFQTRDAATRLHVRRETTRITNVISFFRGIPRDRLREERLAPPLFGGRITDAPEAFLVAEDRCCSNVVFFYPLMAADIHGVVYSQHLGVLSDDGRLHLTHGMVAAVANLHEYGLIHGDVKMENFLVSQAGEVFLADLDTVVREWEPFRRLTPAVYTDPDAAAVSWRAVQRNEYFAAGMWTARVEVPPLFASKYVDAWSLGVTLYKLWCGVLPWRLDAACYATNSKRLKRLARVKERGEQVAFIDCRRDRPVPTNVRQLITGFLNFHQLFRVLPEAALRLFSSIGEATV